jgi:hypothetical protein
MQKYVIERNIPGVGAKSTAELRTAAKHSNEVLASLPAGIQWLESFVTDDKLFCVYLADTEQKIHAHAEKSGFPASAVRPVRAVLDPSSGNCP